MPRLAGQGGFCERSNPHRMTLRILLVVLVALVVPCTFAAEASPKQIAGWKAQLKKLPRDNTPMARLKKPYRNLLKHDFKNAAKYLTIALDKARDRNRAEELAGARDLYGDAVSAGMAQLGKFSAAQGDEILNQADEAFIGAMIMSIEEIASALVSLAGSYGAFLAGQELR
jgi:hypothetical protein